MEVDLCLVPVWEWLLLAKFACQSQISFLFNQLNKDVDEARDQGVNGNDPTNDNLTSG